MRALFIYDAAVRGVPDLGGAALRAANVALFPLVEDDALRQALIQEIGQRSSTVTSTYDSARLVDRQVARFGGFAEWSANLGEADVGGRSLKDALMVPGF